MFATSFCFWGTWAPVYALTAELAPRRAMVIVFGVLNSVAFTASLVAPFVTGWIKDWSGSFAGGMLPGGVPRHPWPCRSHSL